jgi:hypothetical protein
LSDFPTFFRAIIQLQRANEISSSKHYYSSFLEAARLKSISELPLDSGGWRGQFLTRHAARNDGSPHVRDGIAVDRFDNDVPGRFHACS